MTQIARGERVILPEMATPEQAMRMAWSFLDHAIKLEGEKKPIKFIEFRLKQACEVELMSLGFKPMAITLLQVRERKLD